MIKKNKNIVFKASDDKIFHIEEIPQPSNSFLPSWYNETDLYSSGEKTRIKAVKNFFKTRKPYNQTFKGCIPLIDSMTSGYMITCNTNFSVIRTIGESLPPLLDWDASTAPVDLQPKEVLGKYPIPEGYNPNMFRWQFNWKIVTPPGYSCLIMHPNHRNDLPFFTLNAIVDTDKHCNNLFLPFFIKDNFEGIIKQGTPIAQIIPFKRENWVSKKENFDQKDWYGEEIIRRSYGRGYQTNFWSKKEYK